MDLRRLPPAMLIALGLGGCGPDDGDSSTGPTTTGATSATGEPSTGPCLDVQACLKFDVPPATTDSGTDTATDSGTDSATGGSTGGGSGSTSGGGTDSGTDSGEPTTGPCLSGVEEVRGDDDVLGPASTRSPSGVSRQDVLDRLASDGVLPGDVLAKLRRDPVE